MNNKIKPAKLITPEDLAEKLGIKEQYLDAKFEEELKRNHDIIMGDDYVSLEFDIDEDNHTEDGEEYLN